MASCGKLFLLAGKLYQIEVYCLKNRISKRFINYISFIFSTYFFTFPTAYKYKVNEKIFLTDPRHLSGLGVKPKWWTLIIFGFTITINWNDKIDLYIKDIILVFQIRTPWTRIEYTFDIKYLFGHIIIIGFGGAYTYHIG